MRSFDQIAQFVAGCFSLLRPCRSAVRLVLLRFCRDRHTRPNRRRCLTHRGLLPLQSRRSRGDR